MKFLDFVRYLTLVKVILGDKGINNFWGVKDRGYNYIKELKFKLMLIKVKIVSVFSTM